VPLHLLRAFFSKTGLVAFALLASVTFRFWADGQSLPLPSDPVLNRPSKIAINTADQATLESLPGIGPALAKRIVADRRQNGAYHRPEDLLRVSGLGRVRIDGITADIHFALSATEMKVVP